MHNYRFMYLENVKFFFLGYTLMMLKIKEINYLRRFQVIRRILMFLETFCSVLRCTVFQKDGISIF